MGAAAEDDVAKAHALTMTGSMPEGKSLEDLKSDSSQPEVTEPNAVRRGAT